MSTTSALSRESRPMADTSVQSRNRLGGSPDLPGAERSHGIWWPRSLDLAGELARLLDKPAASGHMARRVTYNLDAWQPAPARLALRIAQLRLAGYRQLSPSIVHISLPDSAPPLVLRVLPLSADPRGAERAFCSVTALKAS